MNLKNMKIETQLKLSFIILLFFVIILGATAYLQTDKMVQQIETLYNHPLVVRRAIGNFKSDILIMQRDMKDLFLAADDKEINLNLARIETTQAHAFEQLEILSSQYLGPRTDVDSLKQAFITWNTLREETIRLLKVGKKDEAAHRVKSFGVSSNQAEAVLAALQKVDDFAIKKGDSLYATATNLNNSLNLQLIVLVTIILLLSVVIHYILLRNIRNPLNDLTQATQHFHNGDMNARSAYQYHNEFGVLSDSFNTLAGSIQWNMELNEKASKLAGVMLSEDDAKKFFQSTLNVLSTLTGSQMAAVYLLSDDKTTFQHYESIGLDENARKSFDAGSFEGEFGSVLASRKLQHIKNIPQDTRFIFQTVSGKFIPREIISIPILAGNEVIAIISLASISEYGKPPIQLIMNVLDILSARVEGILAYRKIKDISVALEHQNRELEAQKTELSAQSGELVEQNTELEMQKKQLDEANRLKTSFLSNMSHELRTPLNSVIALTSVLNRRLINRIPAEEYSYLEVIERNGKHLLALINDILDISRIEAGKEEIEITEFDVDTLLSEVLNMIEPQAQQKNIELLQTAKGSIGPITSDVNKCRHIFQNLIGNAVKFTEMGKVEITTQQCDNHISILVTDTGIGIAEDHLPHIFDEFRQADESTSRRFGGTGLGLAIAKKYTNLLGGTLTVKSILGQGSEFTISLPLRYSLKNRLQQIAGPVDVRYSKEPSSLLAIPGDISKTILLVEDNEPAIIQIKDILEESGYPILVARDGREALTIIAQTIPDAMILDLTMPGIDGFQVLKSIREAERTTHIPVLILTAKHITKEELKFLKENNIHQLIQKGDINRNELLNGVASMVFPERAEAGKPPRELQSIKGKPLVLVVEDNPDSMLTVKAILAGSYNLLEATDGKVSVEIAKKHKPNLILMDIELPVMNGIEALKFIRQDGELQHIPVIALTASAMASDRETILAYGFDAYITKPIDEKALFKTINEVLYGR